MNVFFDIFKIHKREQLTALVATVYFSLLNILNVVRFWDVLSTPAENYRRLFVGRWHVSGFDPLTYVVISDWNTSYNVYRHPLLAFFMWPLSQLNRLLMWLTGVNCALPLMGVFLVVCSVYSCLFLYRILTRIIGLSAQSAAMLCALYFTFGSIMLTSLVPDHFAVSQFCLLLTLWLAGEKLRKGSALNMWQTICLFTLTAGVSLNNGAKVILAALVTRRRRFFEWAFLFFAVIVPVTLIWQFARWEYSTFVLPQELARYAVKARHDSVQTERIRRAVIDSIMRTNAEVDSAEVERRVQYIRSERKRVKEMRDSKKIWNQNKGKPFMQGEFMGWTDSSTPRGESMVENLFGEAIQLHTDYALGDVLRNRPAIVRYSGLWRYVNYAVEALLILLAMIGTWRGRRSLFLWTAMSFFLMDMLLHVGLGFGLNEVYIMSAHYLFAIPIAIGYLMKDNTWHTRWLQCAVGAITLFLLIWNGSIILNCL